MESARRLVGGGAVARPALLCRRGCRGQEHVSGKGGIRTQACRLQSPHRRLGGEEQGGPAGVGGGQVSR